MEETTKAMPDRIPMWLDVDTGHDDVFAILIAAHYPTMNLLGVSTGHGNAHLPDTTTNSSSVLTAFGRTDVGVYPGADKPFCREEVFTPEIHGPTGISGTKYLPPPLAPIVKDVNAIVAMRNALMAQPANSAWLVATGPLTNIGLLFATFPEVAPHIAGLSIMGGAVGGGFTGIPSGKTLGQSEGFGNETPWAEFNIYCDPEAAQAVFSNPVLATKTTLICLDLTHQCLATKQVRESLLYAACSAGPSKSPTKLRVLLNEILEFFAASYDEFFDIKAGPPLHDPLAVAVLFGFATSKLKGPHPVIFQDDGERYTIFVVTAGEHSASDAIRGQVGRTVVKASDTTGHGVRIPRKLNVEAFWRVLEDCCSIAEKHVALQQA